MSNDSDQTVWITTSGDTDHYHTNGKCGILKMSNSTTDISLEEARNRGLSECQNLDCGGSTHNSTPLSERRPIGTRYSKHMDDSDTPDPSDRTLKALRVKGSDVYHYAIDCEPLCGTPVSEQNTQYVGDIGSAEQFFDICNTCRSMWDDELGMTTRCVRMEIAHACGIDMPPDQQHFSHHQLRKIFYEVVDGAEEPQEVAGDE